MIKKNLQLSIVGYVVIGVVLFWLVDWRGWEKNRMRYLLGVFYNGHYQNYKDGYLYFDHKVRLEPDNATAWAGLGLCLFQLNHLKESIKMYQQAIALNPKLAALYYQLAIVYEKNDQIVEANKERETFQQLTGKVWTQVPEAGALVFPIQTP